MNWEEERDERNRNGKGTQVSAASFLSWTIPNDSSGRGGGNLKSSVIDGAIGPTSSPSLGPHSLSCGFAPTRGEVYYFSTPGIWV